MYNESTTIVDVVATSDGYALSIKAGDLYIAYEVVRRHIDEDGARHFAQLTESKLTADGYSFTFDTGDVFACAAADEYPASETLSDDSSGGGTGGGVLVVNVTKSEDVITLDKTWQEIRDADAVSVVWDIARGNTRSFLFCMSVHALEPFGGGVTEYIVKVNDLLSSETINFVAASASGYPSHTME